MYVPETLILGPKCLQCRKDCLQESFFFFTYGKPIEAAWDTPE